VADPTPILTKCLERGLRLGAIRREVIALLERADEPFDAESVWAMALEGGRPGMSRASIYRTIRYLAEEGLLTFAGQRNGKYFYTRVGVRDVAVVEVEGGQRLMIQDADLRARILFSIRKNGGPFDEDAAIEIRLVKR
jgi:Fe2+ or Zn2+ uptake regulation protein